MRAEQLKQHPDRRDDIRYAASAPDKDLDKKIKDAALITGNMKLHSELSHTDVVAINAIYHLRCLTELYRQQDAVHRNIHNNYNDQVILAQAFNDLIEYIECQRGCGVKLTMKTLTNMYEKRLAELGIQNTTVHTTRLRADQIC